MTAETAILEARLRQELQQLDKLSEEMKKALKPYQGKIPLSCVHWLPCCMTSILVWKRYF